MPLNLLRSKQGKQKGSIYVTAEKKKKRNGSKKQEVVVSIKDTGTGIDSEIVPRLFTKFATTSETGTGLGYLSARAL